MNKYIQSWAFVESISPGVVPSRQDELKGNQFTDGKTRKRIRMMGVGHQYREVLTLAHPEKYELTYSYYIDSYTQHELVQLFRDFFMSEENIINKSFTCNYSFTFKVNAAGQSIQDSLFIPYVQLIISDIHIKGAIDYDQFSERYKERKLKVEEAARAIFSNTVDANTIQELRTVFRQYFGTLAKHKDYWYIGINMEDKKNTQSLPLFNSFYIDDLQYILENGMNKTLEQFVDGKPLMVDIDEDQKAIENVLEPRELPLGRWPSPVAHRLSLMQQVAVNSILNGNERISSVNGPPGTGKTTLLKDVFAQLVIERTIQMVSYKDPSKAFTQNGKVELGGYPYTMYELDEKLAQHSMVVASSNNGAVENISKDLPKLDSVVRDSIKPIKEKCLQAFAESGDDILYFHECEEAYKEEALA